MGSFAPFQVCTMTAWKSRPKSNAILKAFSFNVTCVSHRHHPCFVPVRYSRNVLVLLYSYVSKIKYEFVEPWSFELDKEEFNHSNRIILGCHARTQQRTMLVLKSWRSPARLYSNQMSFNFKFLVSICKH